MARQQQIMDLWKTCFHDEDEFIRLYFSGKYKDENTLLYEENGKALSALQMIPYPMTWAGTVIPTSYISGACTLPEARNKGMMTRLLKEAFQKMHERHLLFSTLIPAEPWLYDYYSRLGYTPCFSYSTTTYHFQNLNFPEENIKNPVQAEQTFIDSIFPYIERQMLQRSCCIQHPYEDYILIVKDLYSSGGRILASYENDNQTFNGIAFTLPREGHAVIPEMFYNTEKEKAILLQETARIWQTGQVLVKTPSTPENGKKYGMARVTDTFYSLQQIARLHPDLSLSIEVQDPQIPANGGFYHLRQGTCQKIITSLSPTEFTLDIPALTRLLLGVYTESLPPCFPELLSPQQPYMSLMLDGEKIL